MAGPKPRPKSKSKSKVTKETMVREPQMQTRVTKEGLDTAAQKRKADSKANSKAKPRKRKRQTSTRKRPTNQTPTPNETKTHLPPPSWLLLPPSLRETLFQTYNVSPEDEEALSKKVVSLFVGRNANITTTVNRLKGLLGYSDAQPQQQRPLQQRSLQQRSLQQRSLEDEDKDGEGEREREDGETEGEVRVIAISALGQAAGKLVSIIEIVRRVVAVAVRSGGGDGGQEEEEGAVWWVYTFLSSVASGGTGSENGGGKNSIGDAEAADHDQEQELEDRTGKEPEEEQRKQAKPKLVPVLTVWMARKRMPEFGRVLGEQRLEVVRVRGRVRKDEG